MLFYPKRVYHTTKSAYIISSVYREKLTEQSHPGIIGFLEIQVAKPQFGGNHLLTGFT